MKKTKFFTCIAMLGLILSLGACESGDIYIDMGGVDIGGDSSSEPSEGGESTPDSDSSGHTHSYEVTEHKDATCTEAGYDVYTCSCGDTYTETIDALGHTPSGEYQSDENSHWQVCSVCGSKVNEEAHTAGSLSYIDQQYHGTKCTVCGRVLSQAEHNFDAVWDDDFEEWTRVCTDCGLELGSISYDSKYVIVGDFEDASWTLAPEDDNLILEYDSRYQNTQHWIRTVTTTEYDRQGYDAGFRICVYDDADNPTWTTIANYSNLDVSSSTGVLGDGGGNDHNILLDWSTTYEIEVDCSGTTPSIVVTYVSGGYEEEEIDGYAIVGSFDDSSWNTFPDLDSLYYLEPNEANHWERTITAGGDASFSGFRVTEYGTYNTVAGGSNLTSDSSGVSAQAANDNNILTTPGVTYDVVLDIGNTTTIKVTIHEEEVDTSITNETNLQAALNEGGNITLESDIVVTTPLVASKDATLNMNGYTIYNETDIYNDATSSWSLLSIQNGAKVTITGNGTFAGLANDPYAVDVRNGSTLIIENGTFIGNVTCIYIEEGFVSIYGGHFSIIQTSSINGPYKYVLNCYDANNKAGTACFYLYGGEYENFDPSVATGTKDDEGNTLYEAVVMDGYTVVSSNLDDGGTLYSVVEKEEHTYITDLSSLPAAGFGEEHDYTNNVDNPKSGVWTRGIFYYWNGQWDWGAQGAVSVSKAEYDNTTSSYVFSWTTDVDTAVPYAFQVFYTLPEDAGLEQGATYSLTLHLITDFTHYIEICGKAVYVEEGSNTITLSGLTATQYSDLSIQLGDNLYVDDGKCVQNGTIAITYLAFDYLKADVEEGESESHSYIVDFGSTELYEETDAVGTIGNHLGAFVYNYNLVSGNVNLTNDGLTLTYDKAGSAEPPWSGVTLCYNLPADSGLSEGAGAGYKYTIRLTAEHDCTLRINEEEFTLTGGVEFELDCHQSNYGGAASTAPTILMYFASISDSTLVCPNTINITYLAFDF